MRRLIACALAGALAGGLLGLLAIARGHYPFLEAGGIARFVGGGVALAAAWGALVGALSALAARTGRTALARGIWVAAVLALLVGALANPRNDEEAVWAALGPPVPSHPAAPAPRAPRAPNLVLISVDTLRADHLGTYGYPRRTSPAIDRFAREGTVFEVAVAQSPETRRSMASLLTGLYPHVFDYERHLRGKTGPLVGDGFETLAERLAAAGYATAGFVSNPALSAGNGYEQGFGVWDDTSGMFGDDPAGRRRAVDDVVTPALAWLAQVQPPFLLLVHVMDPHHPYEPERAGAWEQGGEAWRAELDRVWTQLSVAESSARMKALRDGERAFEGHELDYLVDRYDSEILQTDAGVQRLLDGLARQGFDESNTLVVLTADHGEEFLDHGGLLHGHTFYDELIRVPLVLRGPGIPAGRRVAEQVRVLDVPATLLARAGLAPGDIDGEDLAPFLAGDGAPARPALSFRGTRYVAQRTPQWKLVAAFEPYAPARLTGVGPAELLRLASRALHGSKRDEIGLWDLASDPRERTNVLAARRATARELYAELSRTRAATPLRQVVSSAQVGPSSETLEQLRALGYAD